MHTVMTINVSTLPALTVNGSTGIAVMIPFTARAEGELFTGETVTAGYDTQLVAEGTFRLSARYILEGTDKDGNKCRVFIENNGTSLDNCVPVIRTDSPVLAFLENCPLSSKVTCVEDGVIVTILAD